MAEARNVIWAVSAVALIGVLSAAGCGCRMKDPVALIVTPAGSEPTVLWFEGRELTAKGQHTIERTVTPDALPAAVELYACDSGQRQELQAMAPGTIRASAWAKPPLIRIVREGKMFVARAESAAGGEPLELIRSPESQWDLFKSSIVKHVQKEVSSLPPGVR